MASNQIVNFKIAEVSNPDSPHIPGMNAWLEEIFPEYLPPRFGSLLNRLRREDGRHQIQLFAGLAEDQVVGLAQVFYQEWEGGLIADIDLLGVVEAYRRSGLALALVRHAIDAARQMAGQYGLPAIGVVSLVDPGYLPVIRLHEKLGGQVRWDTVFPGGDIVVWYPLNNNYTMVDTQALVRQLRLFGRLLEEDDPVQRCPFCPPALNQNQVVMENDACLFLQEPQAVLVGSGIIIPKRHRETVFNLSAEEWEATFTLLLRVKAWLDQQYAPDGYNLGWNAGRVGGQEINHAHLHVIPRFQDEPLAGKGIRHWLKQDSNKRGQ